MVYEKVYDKVYDKRTILFPQRTTFFPIIFIGFCGVKVGEFLPFTFRSLSVHPGKIWNFKIPFTFRSPGEVLPFKIRSPGEFFPFNIRPPPCAPLPET